jgi:hypothetical protein
MLARTYRYPKVFGASRRKPFAGRKVFAKMCAAYAENIGL